MQTTNGTRGRLITGALAFGLALGLSSSAWADIDLTSFELDGNPVNEGVRDWQNVWGNADASQDDANVFTHDGGDGASIFTGGRKDIQDIDQWGHKSGSVPDKDELINGFAYAEAQENGLGEKELVMYFGADRLANNGDAYIGFWLFAEKVVADTQSGKFTGLHTENDLLVLVNYPQGSPDFPDLRVVRWEPACTKASSRDPVPADSAFVIDTDLNCAAKNLALIKIINPNNARCNTGGLAHEACTITNADPEGAIPGWNYAPKTGDPNTYPPESFYEGAINLTEVLGRSVCFSSFMAVSRSSSSYDAALKDFILGNFVTCGMTVTKSCGSGSINATESGFLYSYTGTIENTGFGPLYDLTVDDLLDDTDPVVSYPVTQGVLGVGETATYQGEFEILGFDNNGPTNEVKVSASLTQGGPMALQRSATDECPDVDVDPTISVSKACWTELVEKNGLVAVQVGYGGQVCNDTGVDAKGGGIVGMTLVNVTVQDNVDDKLALLVLDDGGTPNDPADDTTATSASIPAGQCLSYRGSYLPSSVASSDGPFGEGTTPEGRGQTVFTDTVTANGTAIMGGFGTTSSESTTAVCDLCM